MRDLPEILTSKYGNRVSDSLYDQEEPLEKLRVLINEQDHTIIQVLEIRGLWQWIRLHYYPHYRVAAGGKDDIN